MKFFFGGKTSYIVSMYSLELVQILSRWSTPASANRFHFTFAVSYVLWDDTGLSSWPDTVPAVHRRTIATHWEPQSLSASLCWRYTDLWILYPDWIAVATDPSLSMYRSYCWVDAFEPPTWMQRRLKSLVNNQTSSISVAAVIASCWCRSHRAHRHRPEPRHIYQRWRKNEVIMFRHSVITTLYPTISTANVLRSLMSFSVGWTIEMPYCLASLAT